MRNQIIPLVLIIIIIIAILAFFSVKGLITSSSSAPSSGYLPPASALSALISNSQARYNSAGNFEITYQLHFLPVVYATGIQNDTGNYSFENYKNSFNVSLYTVKKVLPDVEQIQHVYDSFNRTKISQCFTRYLANTSVVNSTIMAAINKANANSTKNCSVPFNVPLNLSEFDAAYVISIFPIILPITNSTLNLMSPEKIFANNTLTSLGTRNYLGQSCDLYNITVKSYPENVTFIECISNKVGLPISLTEESSNEVLEAINISSFN